MRVIRWTRTVAMAALFAALVTGCDAGDPAGPNGQYLGPRPLGASPMVCSVGSSSTVQILDTGLELAMAFTVDRVIDSDGGSFGIGASRMIVPAGAVSGPTLFTLNLTIGRYILAEFTAVTADGSQTPVADFDVPIRAEIGYHRLNGYDPSQLTLLYLVDGTVDGAVEEVPVQVDAQRKRILADLSHFSKYAVGIN